MLLRDLLDLWHNDLYYFTNREDELIMLRLNNMVGFYVSEVSLVFYFGSAGRYAISVPKTPTNTGVLQHFIEK